MKKMYFIAAVLLCACSARHNAPVTLVDKADFDTVVDNAPVSLYTLESGSGITMQVTNYGMRIVSLWVPDRDSAFADVAIGYKCIGDYLDNSGERFLGCIVGRYANRIAKGKFTLDGIEYQLPLNNNGQTLHGGDYGLDRVVWNVDSVTANAIYCSYVSPDGADGFPGELTVCTAYELTPDNECRITYRASSSRNTVVNLSNHCFFNLHGEGGGSITDHLLQINAAYITPVDSVLIPTGELLAVDGTPFDFRRETKIGDRVNDNHPQLKNGSGYDHNWVLLRSTDSEAELVATLYEPRSGRMMEVYTDQPGIQFYCGNFFNGKGIGKYGKPIKFREALALETQKFPDSPNHPNFPSTRLNAGGVYTHTCIYKFLTKAK